MIEQYKMVSEGDMSELRQALRNATRNSADGAYLVCELLHRAFLARVNRDGKSIAPWKLWGYPTFDDYVEKEVGVHAGTANGYRLVYQKFGIDWAGSWKKDQILSITKMRCMARSPRINKGNVGSWLKRAAIMSCCELEHELLGAASEHHFAMPVTGRELKVLSTGIEAAREHFKGSDRRGAVLAQIVEEWLTENGYKKKLKAAS